MDIENLLKLLNENEVHYVIIGASAFPTHGYSRATLDLDIFIEKTAENAAKVKLSLEKFGYDLTDLSVDDLLNNKILIRQYIVETDIHPFVKGVEFDEVWNNRVIDTIEGIKVNVASLDDIIKMKKAAGRAKDIEDLRILEELKKQIK